MSKKLPLISFDEENIEFHEHVETLWGPVWADTGERVDPTVVRVTVHLFKPLNMIKVQFLWE